MPAPDSFDEGDIHPIDAIEKMAETKSWDFDRVTDDQIAIVVDCRWCSYSLTFAWSSRDNTLRLICTFALAPPPDKLPALYDVLNRCNDTVWTGSFTWWAEQSLIVWRYGLCLAGDQVATPGQIAQITGSAFESCERFYPAFQLVVGSDTTPADAVKIAIGETYGRA